MRTVQVSPPCVSVCVFECLCVSATQDSLWPRLIQELSVCLWGSTPNTRRRFMSVMMSLTPLRFADVLLCSVGSLWICTQQDGTWRAAGRRSFASWSWFCFGSKDWLRSSLSLWENNLKKIKTSRSEITGPHLFWTGLWNCSREEVTSLVFRNKHYWKSLLLCQRLDFWSFEFISTYRVWWSPMGGFSQLSDVLAEVSSEC